MAIGRPAGPASRTVWTRLRRADVLLVSVAGTAIAALNFALGQGLTEPSILPDEFGYLANAAFLAGIDWSPLVSTIQYYSLGYSILLVPLYRMNLAPDVVYSSAIAINAFLTGAVPPLAFAVGTKLTGGRRPWLTLGAAIAVGLYPSYLIYAHLALAESLLVLLVWLSLFLLARILVAPPSPRLALAFGLVSGGACLVHQRSLGLAAASVVLMALLWKRRLASRGAFGWFLLGVGSTMLLTWCAKRLVQGSLWTGPAERIPARVLSSVTNLDGALAVAIAGLGQTFYLGVASVLLVLVGAHSAVKLSREACSSSRPQAVSSCSPSVGAIPEPAALLSFFSILVLLGTFTLSVALMSMGNRFDQLFYGRYNEAFMGPVLLIGILTLSGAMAGASGVARAVLPAVAIFAFSGWVLSLLAGDEIGRPGGFTLHITGLVFFRGPDWRIEMTETVLPLLCLALMLAVLLRKAPFLGVALLGLYFFLAGYRVSRDLSLGSERHRDNGEISGWLREQEVEGDVYFLRSGDHARDRMRERYQLWLPHLRLVPVRESSQVDPTRSPYLIAPMEFDPRVLPGSVLFAADQIKTFRLWVTSADEVARLRRSGIVPSSSAGLLARNVVARHGVTMYRSKLEGGSGRFVLHGGPEGRLRSLLGLDEMPVRVSHMGTEEWPPSVRVGVIWMNPGRPGRLGEYRVTLPEPMSPGEVEDVEVPLRIPTSGQTELSPGDYEVWVGLVHEHVAWFYEHGDEVLKLQVRVAD